VGFNGCLFGIWLLAKLCMDENIPVTPIPGPCGVVSALSASGLATNEFTFGNFDVIFYGHNVC